LEAPGRRFSNSIGVFVGFSLSALTWKPDPGVKKTTPRGEFELKKLAGRLLGAAKPSGTPSQLISRRPFANEPATFGFRLPRSIRNASTAAWISAGASPDPWRSSWATATVGDASISTVSAIVRRADTVVNMTPSFCACGSGWELPALWPTPQQGEERGTHAALRSLPRDIRYG